MSVTGGMLYKDFVKEHFHKLGDMSAKEKMKKIGEMWRSKTGKAKMVKPKGKGIVGGDAEGAGIFSDTLGGLLGAVGFGMPENVKQKHYKRMVALEKKMHSKGKLSPKEHHKLKVYHTLHGQGFFDSLWSGFKRGVGAVANIVPAAINTIGSVANVVPEIAKVVPGIGSLAAPVMGLASKVAPFAPLAAML
jgi:hypothetical protein